MEKQTEGQLSMDDYQLLNVFVVEQSFAKLSPNSNFSLNGLVFIFIIFIVVQNIILIQFSLKKEPLIKFLILMKIIALMKSISLEKETKLLNSVHVLDDIHNIILIPYIDEISMLIKLLNVMKIISLMRFIFLKIFIPLSSTFQKSHILLLAGYA